MSILEELNDDSVWESFLQYKLDKRHLSEKEQSKWQQFIKEQQYRSITAQLTTPGFTFDYPEKISINKSGTGKKRIVYSFKETESMVLKAMAFLLYRYDNKLSSSCYSFRRNSTAKEAIVQIRTIPHLQQKYCLKADISNYFNSIPPESLLAVLRQIITDDTTLIAFLERLLTADRAYENGNLVYEKRGAMAGTPISPFFANIYLLSLDTLFTEKEIPYFRYSDDILLFADSMQELLTYKDLLEKHITEKGLSLNPDKITITPPGDPWEFLGFCYDNGKMELSHITKEKMKAKIRRKAHYLYRRRIRKQMSFEQSATAMIRTFNRKFYDVKEENAFTWSRWFFPVLDSSDGLKELDAYLLQYIRYLYSGRHYKGNFRISYEQIKALGFRSLVHEYYAFKSEDFSLQSK